METSKFLAFDIGAESGRAIIGTIGDERISLEEIHRFPNTQIRLFGHIYWDILSLFEEMKKGMSIAVRKGHGDIESIGIDTWGVDFGLVGNDGAILGFPFSYRDSRTDGIMEKVFQKMAREEIYNATGIQFMQINSLFQLYALATQNNDLLRMCDTMLFIPDLFNYFLTGKKYSEYTVASTSQLLNAGTKNWDEKIFQRLDLPLSIMAPIIEPGSIIGPLLPEIASETGLKNGVEVVAAGCHDTASAVASVPAHTGNWGYISSGTWSIVGIETDRPLIDRSSMLDNFTNEGGVGGTIRFSDNVVGLWLLQECRKIWGLERIPVQYDQLVRSASGAKEFRSILNPDDGLFLHPPDMPGAIREFCRKTCQPVPETMGEFVRCILESLALKYKTVISKINSRTGNTIGTLHIVGGGSQNELLNQFTADATGVPVEAGPVEATALGNILIQSIARGKIGSLKEGRAMVARSFPIKKYQPSTPEKWEKIFQRTNFMNR